MLSLFLWVTNKSYPCCLSACCLIVNSFYYYLLFGLYSIRVSHHDSHLNYQNFFVSIVIRKSMLRKFVLSACTVWKSTIKRHHAQKISWNQLFFLITSLVKTLIWRKNVDFSVKIVIAFYTDFSNCVAEYGNYETLVSHLFGKNFVKATFY